MMRWTFILGPLLVAGCLDWEPPGAGIDGDADSDADADSDVDVDPCEGVTCSEHGTCFSDGLRVFCDCDEGYQSTGMACIPAGADGDADSDEDSVVDFEADVDADEFCLCIVGAWRYCDTPAYGYWGTQYCLENGLEWGRCTETAIPEPCAEVEVWYSPRAVECCIENDFCCQDMWDIDHDGDTWDSLGNCVDVLCI